MLAVNLKRYTNDQFAYIFSLLICVFSSKIYQQRCLHLIIDDAGRSVTCPIEAHGLVNMPSFSHLEHLLIVAALIIHSWGERNHTIVSMRLVPGKGFSGFQKTKLISFDARH